MGFEKVVGSPTQIIEKEGGIGGALAEPVNDRTECPRSSSKRNEILWVELGWVELYWV